MENRPPMQQSDNLSRALLVLILICLVVLVARSGERDAENDPSAAVVPAEFSPRYDVRMIKLQRGMPIMLRTDTATGESWTMGLLAAGEWKALLEGADGVPSADSEVPGRYEIHAIPQKRGAPTLVRTDSGMGRVWRKGAKSAGPWVQIPNPGEAPMESKTKLPSAADIAPAPQAAGDDGAEADAAEASAGADDAATDEDPAAADETAGSADAADD
jgi:hypothetical protein